MPLTAKQRAFVAAYLKDHNATQAAITAGYSERTAKQQGSMLLKQPEIKAEIDKRMTKLVNRLEITAERVLQERARLAFFDPRRMFREDGTPKAVTELDDDTAAAVAGLDIEDLYSGRGESRKHIGNVLKYKLADKGASLTALEKHLGLYKDDGGDSVPLNIHIHLGDD
jgi:phage terminase small subunit